MSKFAAYFLMKNEDVIEFLKEKTTLFEGSENLTCKEIGDGNLNYVFHVTDPKTNRSVIVKQAGDTARISDEFRLSTDRIRIETDVLILQGKLAPGLVPEIYFFDPNMNCCVMEDLSDHEILRTALLKHQTFPKFADDITTFMVQTLLMTSDVVMGHKEKKELLKRYVNPELCEITEDLVYSEPYNDYHQRNELFPANQEWIAKEIYQDDNLRLEAAKLKFEFMTNSQALIHGDLHTGSIFVQQGSTKVIDPEFAFYGPIGYDVGNVIANMIFAWANGDASGNSAFTQWVEETIKQIIEMFKEKFSKTWDDHVQDVMAKEPGFKAWYLQTILKDTAAVAGLELNRRIIGLAKVKDITSITDEPKRVRAERICLSAAKEFILGRDHYSSGNDFLQTLKQSADKHSL